MSLPRLPQSKYIRRLLEKRLRLLKRWHRLLGDSEFYLDYAVQMENQGNYEESARYLKLAQHNIARYDRISKHIDRLSRRIKKKEKN